MAEPSRLPIATHTRMVNFRAADSLMQRAEEVARREGMSLSEFVRHAIRREVKEAA